MLDPMRKSRLPNHIQLHLMEHFVAGTTARVAAELVGVNRKTAAFYFHRLRQIITMEIAREYDEIFGGEVEIDESYFGGKRKALKGRNPAGKMPVFGILKRGGKVYTQVIPDISNRTLIPIIKRKVRPDSVVFTDAWRGYLALDVMGWEHHRIWHSKEQFAAGRNHINGIENFWSQAKRHLRKFNGVPRENFLLFLKECEWRFNVSDPKERFMQLKQWTRGRLR